MEIQDITFKDEPENGINGDGDGMNFDEMIESPQMHFLDSSSGLHFLAETGLNDSLPEVTADSKFLACEYCGKMFGRRSHLSRHINLHTGEKPFACELCDQRFVRSETRARHMQQVHKKHMRYKCKVCQMKFVTIIAMQEHKKDHVQERLFACEVCGNRFSRKETLELHMQKHLPRSTREPQGHACDVCGRIFNRKDHMLRHKNLHTGIKMFECALCSRRFSRRENQTKHQQTCAGGGIYEVAPPGSHNEHHQPNEGPSGSKEHTSDIENGKLSSRDGAVQIFLIQNPSQNESPKEKDMHKKYSKDPVAAKLQKELIPDYTQITSPAGIRYIKCNLCDKQFRHKQHLLRHQYIHLGIKPFKCDQCERAFTRKEHLIRHETIHQKKITLPKDTDDLFLLSDTDPLAPSPDDILIDPFCSYQDDLSLGENSGNDMSSMLEVSMGSSAATVPMPKVINVRVDPDSDSITSFTWQQIDENDEDVLVPDKCFVTSNSRSWPCDLCDKVFPKQCQLTRHYTVHSSERRYKCDVCHRTFTRLEHRKRHMAIHSKERRYECDLCEKTFSRSDHLLTHVKGVHASVKPYRCPKMCGERFDTFTEKAAHARECQLLVGD